MLRGEWDETVNHIITECGKLAQNDYTSTNDWVVNLIH